MLKERGRRWCWLWCLLNYSSSLWHWFSLLLFLFSRCRFFFDFFCWRGKKFCFGSLIAKLVYVNLISRASGRSEGSGASILSIRHLMFWSKSRDFQLPGNLCLLRFFRTAALSILLPNGTMSSKKLYLTRIYLLYDRKFSYPAVGWDRAWIFETESSPSFYKSSPSRASSSYLNHFSSPSRASSQNFSSRAELDNYRAEPEPSFRASKMEIFPIFWKISEFMKMDMWLR